MALICYELVNELVDDCSACFMKIVYNYYEIFKCSLLLKTMYNKRDPLDLVIWFYNYEYSKHNHNQAVITVQNRSKSYSDRLTVLISIANIEITSLWLPTVQVMC